MSCRTLCDTMDCSMPCFPLSSTIFQGLLRSMSTESVILSNNLILCHPLLLLPSVFPSTGVFSNEVAVHIRWPNIGASASVLPMSIQGWFLLGLTGLMSLLSKEFSRVYYTTTVQKHQFFITLPSYGPTLTSVHDYWKDHSLDYTDLCRQSDVFAF